MLSAIPYKLRAGDTWQWSAAFADYPAGDGWILTTSFRGTSALDVIGEQDGDGWTNTAPAADTADLAAGKYVWITRVALDAEVFTVAKGTLEILADLAAAEAGFDGRTIAEIQLDTAETAFTALLSKKNSSVSFGDQSFTLQDIEKLKRIRDELRTQVANEKLAANGRPRRTIKISFPSC